MLEFSLGTDKISKLAVKYCVPAIIGMAITGTQTMIDGLFVGNFIGSDAMASVNIANPFVQLIIGISMVLSIGSQSYLGLTLGEGDVEKGQSIFKTAVISLLGLGLLVTSIGFFFNESLASLLGANDVLLEGVSTYIKTISIFTLPMVTMFLFGFVNRIIERPDLYVYGMILSVVVNISLNFLLIATLNLGIFGAAMATGLSYSSALFVVIWPCLKKETVVNIYKGQFNLNLLKPVVYNGASEGINSLSVAISAFVFNMAFMQIAGEDGVAAFTAINYIAGFGVMIMFGISDGIGPIASYNYGSRQFYRVKQILNVSYGLVSIVSMIAFCLLMFYNEQLVTLFIQDNTELISFATAGAKLYAFSFLFNGFNIVYSGFFTAIGHARSSIIVASSRGLIFILIGIYVLPKVLGTNGVWLTVPFAELIGFIFSLILLRVVYKDMTRRSQQHSN